MDFENSKFLRRFLILGHLRMTRAKFGPFRTNRFEVIAIFVNFNWRAAAILDFSKFHFGPENRLRGAETKLRLKFGGNRSRGFGVIEFLVFFKMTAGGHLGFRKL